MEDMFGRRALRTGDLKDMKEVKKKLKSHKSAYHDIPKEWLRCTRIDEEKLINELTIVGKNQ